MLALVCYYYESALVKRTRYLWKLPRPASRRQYYVIPYHASLRHDGHPPHPLLSWGRSSHFTNRRELVRSVISAVTSAPPPLWAPSVSRWRTSELSYDAATVRSRSFPFRHYNYITRGRSCFLTRKTRLLACRCGPDSRHDRGNEDGFFRFWNFPKTVFTGFAWVRVSRKCALGVAWKWS